VKKFVTALRKLLISFFENHSDRQYSIEEITGQLCNENSISVSAVYRNIEMLTEEGFVRRFTNEGSRKSMYQYIGGKECDSHLHLKCTKCGRVIHTDNEEAEIILQLILQKNKFDVDEKSTLLYGRCQYCH